MYLKREILDIRRELKENNSLCVKLIEKFVDLNKRHKQLWMEFRKSGSKCFICGGVGHWASSCGNK